MNAELRQLAEWLALEAGNITLKYFGKRIAVDLKADQSPVTIADRSAEEFIRRELEKRCPNDGIHGEEFGSTPGRSGRRWIIDPIDGTKSFIRGVPLYGTMIGIEENGEYVVGVIRYPATGQTIAAHKGGGCALDGEPCRVSQTAVMAEATFTTTSLEHWAKVFGEESIARVVRATKFQRTWGDCYGYMLLASGQVDIMMDPIVEVHDFAALVPIVTEAGGVCSDVSGNMPTARSSFVAANAILQPQVRRILAP